MAVHPSVYATPKTQAMPRVRLGPPISPLLDRSVDRLEPPPVGGGGGGGGAPVVLPFKMKDASPDVAHPKVNVVTGTVMDFTPTGIATDTALTDNATNTVYLDCTIDAAGLVTAVAMSISTSGKPADSTYHAYLLIGTATVASGVVTLAQSLYFSQGFKACDRDSGDPATTPGSYQFFVR